MFDLKLFLENCPNPMFVIRPIIVKNESRDFEYIYVNKSFCLFLGREEDELTGKKYSEVFEIGEEYWFTAFRKTVQTKKNSYVEADSSVIGRHLFAQLFPIEEEYCGCIIQNFEEISKNIKFISDEENLIRRANYDFLTGFYNRYYLNEYAATISTHSRIGIVCVDINDLKIINNTYGREYGDKKIQNLAKQLKRVFSKSQIFRVGGDEFVVIDIVENSQAFLKSCSNLEKNFLKSGFASIGYAYYETKDWKVLRILFLRLKICIKELSFAVK